MKHSILKFGLFSLMLLLAFACEKPNAEENKPSTEKPGLLAGVTIELNFDEDKVTATTAQADYSIDLGAASGAPINVKIKYSIAESLNEGSSSTYVKTLDKSASYVVLDGLLFDRIYYYEVYTELYGTKYTSGKGTFKTSAVSVAMNDPRETDEGLVLSGKVQGVAQEDKQQLGVYLCFNEAGYSDKVQRFDFDVPESNEIEVLIPGLNIATDYEYWWVIWDDETKTEEGDKLTYTTNDPYAQPKEVSAAGTDLSADGTTANCYIVPASGAYKFKMTKGNSSEPVGNVASVRVLWESFGTAVSPKPFELISAAGMDGEYALFEVPQDYKEGNAVIAAYDAAGTILWSWHIWLTSAQMTEITYANGAGIMLDRNLGALSATPNDAKALGLFYQWGRKDPFLGSSSISHASYARSTRYLKETANTPETATLSYALENPHKFILANNEGNWLASKDNSLWSSVKTIYDPCPVGWCIPEGGFNDGIGETGMKDGLWAKAGIPGKGPTQFAEGDDGRFGKLLSTPFCTPESWYPAAGSIDGTNWQIHELGVDGVYASVTAFGGTDTYVTGLLINYLPNDSVHYIYCGGQKWMRAGGVSVRCCKE